MDVKRSNLVSHERKIEFFGQIGEFYFGKRMHGFYYFPKAMDHF